jgi:signal transduction histidine kinase
MECTPTRVIVEDLCRHLIAEATSHSVSPRTIELLVAPAIGESFLDEKIFRHILGNLLSNALKYSSDGQPVKLEVRRVAGSPRPNGGTDTSSETHLEFKVSDSGIGIPAADIAKLYQTFHRAANVGNRPGTGMGLAIVKQFVDLHRGTIRFESEEGKGTTVWVHLPVALPASQKRI